MSKSNYENNNKNIKEKMVQTNNKNKDPKIETKNTFKTTSKPPDKKNVVIPNSLTILVKTRIPNYSKIVYDPSMTVTTSRSHTVYFDPLVKYNRRIINNILSYAPPEALYTQFFEANQFDSMIYRTLSSFFNMQSKIDLEDAAKNGTVNNNINLTLQTLFKPNNLFYINRIPYTIVDKHWTFGEWRIDTKPDSKIVPPYSKFSTSKNARQEADKELEALEKAYPNAMEGNQNVKPSKDDDILSIIEKGNTNIANQKKIVPNVSDLFSPAIFSDEAHYIIQNNPINFTNEPDLSRDPITFSLLIDNNELSGFLKKNMNTETGQKIIEYYRSYNDIKEQLFNDAEKYKATKEKIKTAKKAIDENINKMKLNIASEEEEEQEGGAVNLPLQYKKNTEEYEEFLNMKKQFITLLLELSDDLNTLLSRQISYYGYIVDILKEIKKEYANIIHYEDKIILAMKCIDTDINIYELLSSETSTTELNENSQAYFKNIKQFQQKNNKLIKEAPTLMSDQNIQEFISDFKINPSLLDVEKNQLDMYIFVISFTYELNELNIWKIYYEGTEKLTNEMIYYFNETVIPKIDLFNTNTKNIEAIEKKIKTNFPLFTGAINKTTTVDTSYKMLSFLKLKTPSGPTKQPDVSYVLMDSNEMPLINKEDPQLNENEYKEYKKYETQMIEFIKLKVEMYDFIILFTFLLQIKCLRLDNLLISERNVAYIDKLILDVENKYYDSIRYSLITDSNTQIPSSFFWKTNKLNDILIIKNKIEATKKSQKIQNHKITKIKIATNENKKYCSKLFDLLYPVMGKKGIETQCSQLIDGISQIPHITTLISFSLFSNEVNSKNIDIDSTIEFNNNILVLFKSIYDPGNDFDENDETVIDQDWIVYTNYEYIKLSSDNTDVNYVNAPMNYLNIPLAAIATALNGQLDYLNATSINMYTEVLNQNKPSIRRFSASSLLKLVTDYGKEIIDAFVNQFSQFIKVEKDIIEFSMGRYIEGIKNLDLTTGNSVDKIEVLVEYLYSKKMTIPLLFRKNFEDCIIKTIEEVLQISFIIIDMYDEAMNYDYNTGENGELDDIVLYKNRKYVITDINNTDSNDVKYNIKYYYTDPSKDPDGDPSGMEGFQNVFKNIIINDLKYVSNIHKPLKHKFILNCDGNDFLSGKNENEYIFLLRKPNTRYNNYEAVRNSSWHSFVCNQDQIPEYIVTWNSIDCLNIDMDEIPKFENNLGNIYKISSQLDEYDETDEDEEKEDDRWNNVKKEINMEIANMLDNIKNYTEKTTDDKINQMSLNEINFYIQENKMLNDTLSTLSVVFTDYPDLDIDKNKINIDGEQKKLQNIKRKLLSSSDNKEIASNVPTIWEKLKADPNYFKNEMRSLEQFIEKYKYYLQTNKIDITDEDKYFLDKIDTYISDLRNFKSTGQRPEIPESWVSYIPVEERKTLPIQDSDDDVSSGGSVFFGGSDKPRDLLKEYAVVNNDSPYGMYGRIPTPYGQSLGQTYGQSLGQPLGRPYGQTYGQTYGQPVGQPLGQPLGQALGQPVGQPLGQPYGTYRPYPYGLNSQVNPYNMNYFNYSPQYNIAKESKSKLSYYITIELELFPGTDMDTIQKYSVKCQSKFEKIREAWAKLFGYQYRPSQMDNAYAYQTNYALKTEREEKEKEKDEKEAEEKAKKEAEEKEKEKEVTNEKKEEKVPDIIEQVAGTNRSKSSKRHKKHKNISIKNKNKNKK